MVRDVYRICEVSQAQKALIFGNYGRNILIATTKSRINLDHETTIVFNGCFTWKSSKSLPEKCMFRVLGSDPETGFSRGQTQSVQVQADNPHTTRQSFAWFLSPKKPLRHDKDALLQRLCLLSEDRRCLFGGVSIRNFERNLHRFRTSTEQPFAKFAGFKSGGTIGRPKSQETGDQ